MPELPEVETVRRGLAEAVRGWTIAEGEVFLARSIAAPADPVAFLAGVQGKAIATWQRRGKYLLGQLRDVTGQPAGWLGAHLRMTGRLLWLDPAEPLAKHTQVRLGLVRGGQRRDLRFVDPRTFGRLWWVPVGVAIESVITGLAKLGPEPLAAEFALETWVQRLGTRRGAIKAALLDQALVAGLGNIYADEALFLAGIRPDCRCDRLDPAALERLHHTIRQVLQTAIDAGGTTFSDFTSLKGVNGNYGGQAWVYGRKGQACRICSEAIVQIRLAGRSAHFCPQCQPGD